MDFDEFVKAQKAAEWLIQNDALIRTFSMQMEKCPAVAIVYAARYGELIRDRLNEIAPKMTVTDEERLFGYPVPETDEQKQSKLREIQRVLSL